ncbi:hypothetical protein HBI63_077310 [Parastagonospora nodorum]|nr:hypothetical protein HBI63_077310 [Parastagonospora nodorum]
MHIKIYANISLKSLLLKLLKKILLIAIRIYYCVILYYLVYKHSCLLTYYSLIYIRIISRDRQNPYASIAEFLRFYSRILALLYRILQNSSTSIAKS